MNLYEIIGQSWKTTWNHKILWIPGICLALISILYMPIGLLTNPVFSPFTSADFSHLDLRMILIGDAAVILLLIFSLPIMVLATIMNTLGAFHAKQGVEELSFAALLKESLTKFWRVLGIFLTISIIVVVLFTVVIGCLSILAILTMGFGMILVLPILVIVFVPFAILVYAIEEFGIAAIITDNLGIFNAIKKGWELTAKNIGIIIMLCIIIYLTFAVAGIALSIPMMIPMYSMMSNVSGGVPDFQTFRNVFQQGILLMLIFSPFYIVFEGIALTFVQAIWTLAYIQTTKPKQEKQTPVALPANA